MIVYVNIYYIYRYAYTGMYSILYVGYVYACLLICVWHYQWLYILHETSNTTNVYSSCSRLLAIQTDNQNYRKLHVRDCMMQTDTGSVCLNISVNIFVHSFRMCMLVMKYRTVCKHVECLYNTIRLWFCCTDCTTKLMSELENKWMFPLTF
jgi:hypothetical protein